MARQQRYEQCIQILTTSFSTFRGLPGGDAAVTDVSPSTYGELLVLLVLRNMS